MQPKFYMKVNDLPEFEVTEVIPELEFLGLSNAPVIVNSYQQNTSQDGQRFVFQTYDKTTSNAAFLFNFADWYDFTLITHKIYHVFAQRALMRIRTDADPALIRYVRPASFEVKPIEEGAHDAAFTIPFENPSGYKYSFSRSDELPMTGEWQLGMNLPFDRELNYQFTQTSFQVYNASDIAIDPYTQKHDLKMICHFSGEYLRVENQTNHSIWTYNKPSKKSDTIVLDGIHTTLNNEPASVNTDFGNLILERGWNEVSVEGATDMDITFSFPFIYLG